MVAPVDHDIPTLVSDDAAPPTENNTEIETMTDADVAQSSKVPRPPNCFIMYRKDWHSDVVAANPGMHNNDISKIIGAKWKAEPQVVRDEYHLRAEEAKRQHAIDHPDYQYQPRKPSQKKKRMTKNKIAKLAAKSARKSTAIKPSAHLLDVAGGLAECDMFEPAPAPAPAPTPTPCLEVHDNDTFTVKHWGEIGNSAQLNAEVTEFFNSRWTPAQQAFMFSQAPRPLFPRPAPGENFTRPSPDRIPTPIQKPAPVQDLKDANVAVQYDEGLYDSELLRQIGLEDELNNLFDFDGFIQN